MVCTKCKKKFKSGERIYYLEEKPICEKCNKEIKEKEFYNKVELWEDKYPDLPMWLPAMLVHHNIEIKDLEEQWSWVVITQSCWEDIQMNSFKTKKECISFIEDFTYMPDYEDPETDKEHVVVIFHNLDLKNFTQKMVVEIEE